MPFGHEAHSRQYMPKGPLAGPSFLRSKTPALRHILWDEARRPLGPFGPPLTARDREETPFRKRSAKGPSLSLVRLCVPLSGRRRRETEGGPRFVVSFQTKKPRRGSRRLPLCRLSPLWGAQQDALYYVPLAGAERPKGAKGPSLSLGPRCLWGRKENNVFSSST